MKDRFSSPDEIRQKLIKSFPDYVPSQADFQIGYLEGRASGKRWIICDDDVDAMYKAYFEGDVISVWCDGKSILPNKPGKRKSPSDDASAPATKREARIKEQSVIFEELKTKHTGKSYSDPQLRLWAKLIQSGMHGDYDSPPNIPLITGGETVKTKKKSQDSTVTGAFVSAANAIAAALNPQEANKSYTTPSKQSTHKSLGAGVSPISRSSFRRSLLQDLETLHKFYENCVLSPEEFGEQKETILKELKNLTA